MGKKYTEEERVRTYDVTPEGFLSPVSILKYFQEISNAQLTSLDLGLDFTGSMNLSWVLIKYEIEFHSLPGVEEKIFVSTEPTRHRGFEAERMFYITDKEGNLLCSGRSIWVLLNMETESFTRFDEISEFEILGSEQKKPERIRKLRDLKDWDYETLRELYYSDTDINHHINNSVYLEMALDALPVTLLEEHRLKKLSIGFISQAFSGDKLLIRVKRETELEYRVDILKDDEIVAKLKLIFDGQVF